jgi:hypothetical protein
MVSVPIFLLPCWIGLRTKRELYDIEIIHKCVSALTALEALIMAREHVTI